jgi:GAF domain-containing protein/HAMP domain-containing protein
MSTSKSPHLTPLPEQLEEQQRIVTFRWMIRIAVAGAISFIVLFILLYWLTGIWQGLVHVGFLIGAIAAAIAASRMIRHGRLDAAGYLTLFGIVVAFCAGESVWEGVTWYNLIGVMLMTLLVGSITLPHKAGVWAVAIFLSGAMIALLNWLQPIPRYDISQTPLLNIFLPGLLLLMGLAILWQSGRILQAGTIRTRLLIAFVVLTILPMSITTTVSNILGARDAQEHVKAQLESVATLKEAEIQTWLDTLQNDLVTAMSIRHAMVSIRTLLEQESPSFTVYASLRTDFRNTIGQTRNLKELFLINQQGQAILSSERSSLSMEGADFSNEDFFKEGLKGPYVQTPKRDFPSPGQVTVIVARPIPNLQGEIIGVLAGHASLEDLNTTMQERAGLGDTGETYLVSPDKILLTASRFEGYLPGETYVQTDGAAAALQGRDTGSGVYNSYRGLPVVGVYHWLPDLKVVLLAEQDQSEALVATFETLRLNIGVTIVSALVAIVAGLLVTRSIAVPLSNLTATASQIAAGNLELKAPADREDEVGILSRTFNRMTTQLRDLIEGLEQRVADRTWRLEIVANLGERLSGILDFDQLLDELVNRVKESFDYYHAHVYILDEEGEELIMTAGAGEPGRQMKAKGHHIPLAAPTSLVARAARNNEIVWVDNVREVEDWLPNPLLPDTYSEMAVPIVLEGQVVGVLDVQQDKIAGLDEGDAGLLRSLANQVAVAVRNARLFEQIQAALSEVEALNRRLTHEVWADIGEKAETTGYVFDKLGAAPTSTEWLPAMTEAVQQKKLAMTEVGDDGGSDSQTSATNVAVPLILRGEVIGVIGIERPPDRGWSADELAAIQAITEQIALALDSARLSQETERSAWRDRVISETTAKVWSSAEVEEVMKAAVAELGSSLGVSEVVIRLGGTETEFVEELSSEV